MQVRDRTEVNKALDVQNYFPPFFSVLLPELGRPEYVTNCVRYLIKNADMPFEVILHDDSSGKEKQELLLKTLSDCTSTMIFNTSRTMGLAMAMNRCRKMARSKYLLKMDTDIYVTSGTMINMKAALDLPYCGMVIPVKDLPGKRGDKNIYISPDGVKVMISNGSCMSSLIFGIRGDVWDECGGWDENVQSTASDVGFLGNIYGKGYYTMCVEGTYLNESYLSEDGISMSDNPNPAYVSSARFSTGENNGPRLHNIPPKDQDNVGHKRQEDCWHGTNDERLADTENGIVTNSWYGGAFHCQETVKLYGSGPFINWDVAKDHGQDKWKDRIIKDFNLDKE